MDRSVRAAKREARILRQDVCGKTGHFVDQGLAPVPPLERIGLVYPWFRCSRIRVMRSLSTTIGRLIKLDKPPLNP